MPTKALACVTRAWTVPRFLFRDECLNERLFSSLAVARRMIEALRIDNKRERPQTSLDELTPTVFVTRVKREHTQTDCGCERGHAGDKVKDNLSV